MALFAARSVAGPLTTFGKIVYRSSSWSSFCVSRDLSFCSVRNWMIFLFLKASLLARSTMKLMTGLEGKG